MVAMYGAIEETMGASLVGVDPYNAALNEVTDACALLIELCIAKRADCADLASANAVPVAVAATEDTDWIAALKTLSAEATLAALEEAVHGNAVAVQVGAAAAAEALQAIEVMVKLAGTMTTVYDPL